MGQRLKGVDVEGGWRGHKCLLVKCDMFAACCSYSRSFGGPLGEHKRFWTSFAAVSCDG